jgi:hypothetical protein
VFVVHGGLFHSTDITLGELDTAKRNDFSLQDLPEEGEPVAGVGRSNKEDYLKQIVRDALWSDPAEQNGMTSNVRGTYLLSFVIFDQSPIEEMLASYRSSSSHGLF